MDLKSNTSEKLTTAAMLTAALIVYWVGIFRSIELPGLYMDAINPDYLAARFLNPTLDNPNWALPSRWFPILGNLYHGVQNLYVGLPVFWLLGSTVASARIAQAIFGAAIVALVFAITRRATGSRLLAMVVAVGLATEIAFIASFRTQNYIILSGQAWLLGSLLLLFSKDRISDRRALISGILAGFSIYGYFVFGFFLPAMLYIVWRFADRKMRSMIFWSLGVAIGMIPYAIGYFSMWLALDGNFLKFIANATTNLAPLSSKMTILEGYRHALSMIELAMANGGNYRMIFSGDAIDDPWGIAKFSGLLFLTMALLLLLGLRSASGAPQGERRDGKILAILPACYLLIAGLLGKRLWVHHFSVMVPFFYLIAAIAANEIFNVPRKTWITRRIVRNAGSGVIVILLLLGNFIQQQSFFSRLERTGGEGLASSALTALADDARGGPHDIAYLFPEWGFFMSFAFLTQNSVPYWFDADELSIKNLRGSYREVRIPFWKIENGKKYEETLSAIHAKNISLRTFKRRDGEIAFYMISASL